MKKYIFLILVTFFVFACSDDTMTPQEDAENIINEQVILPAGSYTLDEDPETDESVEITSETNGVSRVYGGNKMKVSIPFNSANGNVVGAGMRFGKNGKIHVIPIPEAKGNNSGTLSFDFQIPPEICQELSRICHDIKCYEFAVTDVGNISKENINDLALMCGNCDEPSCRGLVNCDYNHKVWWNYGGKSYEAITDIKNGSGNAAIFLDNQLHVSGSANDDRILISLPNINSIEVGKTYIIPNKNDESFAAVFNGINIYYYDTNPTFGSSNTLGGEITITSFSKKNGIANKAEGIFNFKAENIDGEVVTVTGGFSLNL